MKKIFALGAIFGAILALGGMAFSVYTAKDASASSLTDFAYSDVEFATGFGSWESERMFKRHGMGEGHHGMKGNHPLAPYLMETAADILGVTVEDLENARENGLRLSDFLEDAGLTPEEFHTQMEAALPGIVEQALADGAITQEQADLILENGLPGPKGSPFGALKEYVEPVVADILGLTVEELQAAKEDGTRMAELLENAGLTAEEFKAELDAATPGIVEQALADGAITQEQADLILENGLPIGKGGCKGGRGPHGDGFGPGGFGPGHQNAPATSSDNG